MVIKPTLIVDSLTQDKSNETMVGTHESLVEKTNESLRKGDTPIEITEATKNNGLVQNDGEEGWSMIKSKGRVVISPSSDAFPSPIENFKNHKMVDEIDIKLGHVSPSKLSKAQHKKQKMLKRKSGKASPGFG